MIGDGGEGGAEERIRVIAEVADLLGFGILGDVDGCGFGDDVFEEAVEEFCAVLDA